MKAIMYHYVREPEASLPHFKYLNIGDFKKQLDYFQKKFGFVEKGISLILLIQESRCRVLY